MMPEQSNRPAPAPADNAERDRQIIDLALGVSSGAAIGAIGVAVSPPLGLIGMVVGALTGGLLSRAGKKSRQ